MKFLIICLVAMFAVCVKGNKEMMMKVMTDCQASVGATDEDVGKLMLHAPLENQQQKCMFSCMMGAMNIVKDGKLQKDGLIGMVDKMFSGDAAMKAAAAELYDECHSAEGGEPCESASNIGTCLKTNGQKKKLSFGI